MMPRNVKYWLNAEHIILQLQAIMTRCFAGTVLVIPPSDRKTHTF